MKTRTDFILQGKKKPKTLNQNKTTRDANAWEYNWLTVCPSPYDTTEKTIVDTDISDTKLTLWSWITSVNLVDKSYLSLVKRDVKHIYFNISIHIGFISYRWTKKLIEFLYQMSITSYVFTHNCTYRYFEMFSLWKQLCFIVISFSRRWPQSYDIIVTFITLLLKGLEFIRHSDNPVDV